MTDVLIPRNALESLVWLRSRWPALVIGIGLSIIAATAAAIWLATVNEDTENRRFGVLANRVASQIDRQFRLFEYGLRGARGAVIAAGGDGITRERFRQYSETRNVNTEFSGARGFGFIRLVKPEAEEAFVKQARGDGRSDFQIRQLSPHAGERFVIQYIEPEWNNLEAVGLDIASEPLRRDAAVKSRASGEAALTAPITLVQASGKRDGGFLLLLPVFRAGAPIATSEQRDAATIGWTYAPLVIDEVLSGFDMLGGEFAFSITDHQSRETPTFFVMPNDEPRNAATLNRHIILELYGRKWEVEVWARPLFFERLNLTSPWSAALAIFATGALLTGLLHLYLLGLKRRLQASVERSRLAAIVEGSNDAIIGKTVDGVITDWNAAAERLFGYSALEALGRKAAEIIIPPDHVAEEVEALAMVSEGITVPHFRTKRMTRHGELVDMLVNLSPIRSEAGILVGVATTARDISAQISIENQIGELNASLEQQVLERTSELSNSLILQTAILKQAAYAVIATDSTGVITLFNPAAEHMLGYRADEVIGAFTPALFHDQQEIETRAALLSEQLGRQIKPRFDVVVAQANSDVSDAAIWAGVTKGVWTYITKTGNRIPVRLSISRLISEDGSQLGYLGIAMNLTDQLKRESELETAKKRAEGAANAKSEFLAAMSHELRTPLNSIIGFSGLMLDSGELKGATIERQAQLVHSASKTLLSVVNDVLDVSKFEANSLELDHQPFSPGELIGGAAELLQGAADSKGVVLRVEGVDSLPKRLLGDDARLRQVLLNLLSNALKFTAKGEVKPIAATVGGDDEKSQIRISVKDTGIGIPDSARHRIFRRFSQVDSKTSRTYGGTGLGLSICKSLVEKMGGTIGYDSVDGKGSEFWFIVELPIVDAARPLAGFGDGDEDLDVRPATILLAEDGPMNQELAVAILAKWGHRVDVVSDGAEALAAVRDKRYDLVLMDIQMPVMDGVEATKRIRALGGNYATLPIVAMTATVLSDEVERFKEAGMNDHLGKPFVPRHLQKIVNHWTRKAVEEKGTDRDGTFEKQKPLLDNGAPVSEAKTDGILIKPGATQLAIEQGLLDETVYSGLAEMVGTDKANNLARRFAQDLAKRFAETSNRDTLRVDAHSITSTAGMIGFTSLSNAARALEQACQGNGDFAVCLRDFLDKREGAREFIAKRFGS